MRELSLAVSGPSADGQKAEQVSLRVVERAGEVQVAVRTSDSQLTGDLREQLPDLVSELAGRGYRAETWQPLAGAGTGEALASREHGRDSGPGRLLRQCRGRLPQRRKCPPANNNSSSGAGRTPRSRPGFRRWPAAPLNREQLMIPQVSAAPRVTACGGALVILAPAASSDPLAQEQTFLQLLVAQVQNQDPMDPTADPTEYVTQLAQFSSLEQLTEIHSDSGHPRLGHQAHGATSSTQETN